LFQNEIIRPKIRQRIHHLCHRALMNEKLSDEQLTDWVGREKQTNVYLKFT
jgi:hypothetical protein